MIITPRRYRAQTWIDPRQQFRPSPIEGIGSFTRAPIRQGEVVEIVGGEVMTEAEFRRFQETASRYNAIQIGEHLHLVERPKLTELHAGGVLNHSCDSNLWMADEVTSIARRDIAAGEELTVDYALFTAQADWALDSPCHCGASVCRHTVTGNDWQLPEVQQRYYPHFSPFINRRIERVWKRQASPLAMRYIDASSRSSLEHLLDLWFAPKPFESTALYERLGVLLIKKYAPTGGDIVNRRYGITIADIHPTLDSLVRFERMTRVWEAIHIAVFLGFLTYSVRRALARKTSLPGFGIAVFVYLSLMLSPAMLQRYNRLRVYAAIRRMAEKEMRNAHPANTC